MIKQLLDAFDEANIRFNGLLNYLWMGLISIVLIILTIPCSWATKPFKTLQWQTQNGARVVFYQAMDVPMLNISIAFAAGSAQDGQQFGLSALTTRLLDQGNSGLNATTIAEQLAETGAQYEDASTQDMAVFNLKTLTSPEALKKATETFASIIASPDFPEDAFQREKNHQIMAISETQESPDDLANQTFFQALYKNHPYAHPVMGRKDSVAQIQIEDVRKFYHQFFVGRNAVIVIVGAIDQSKASQLAELITHKLLAGQASPKIPMALPLTEEINIEVVFPSSQTAIRLGQLGITHDNPQYFPLLVGNYILGGGNLVSRLSQEIRESRGLTYGVYSQFLPMPGIGPFLISLSTKNQQTKTATEIARQTLTSFINQAPNEQDLIAAKQYLMGSFPLSLASNQSIANMLLKIAFYHLPEDYLQSYVDKINAVTAEQIQTAFKTLIVPGALLEVSVGKK